MAVAHEKSKVMIRIGMLLDRCRECPKNFENRDVKQMEAICNGCPVYEEMKGYRVRLGAYSDKKKRRRRIESLLHTLTKELYRQHKRDGWTDDEVLVRYKTGRNSLIKWKRANFTPEELKEMNLSVGRKKEA